MFSRPSISIIILKIENSFNYLDITQFAESINKSRHCFSRFNVPRLKGDPPSSPASFQPHYRRPLIRVVNVTIEYLKLCVIGPVETA